MRRRDFVWLAGGLVARPAFAQDRAGKQLRMGFLSNYSASAGKQLTECFTGALRPLGWLEGKNLTIEYRWADSISENYQRFAQELVSLNLDIIAVNSTPATQAMRRAADVRKRFWDMATEKPDGLIVLVDGVTLSNRELILDLAARAKIPAIYQVRDFVDAGGLMSYGLNFCKHFARAATYVDKILRGAKPADLPAAFELVVNVKTARALDLTIAASLLARADEVIE